MPSLSWYIATLPLLLEDILVNIKEIFPYLLAGVIVGELLKFTSWSKILYIWVNKSPFISVITASIIGILSPLCTYGTIPVAVELYRCGINIAPIVSFLSSSSLMNPQLFVMTLGGIGVEMAVVRVIAVFIFSVLLGIVTHILPERFVVRKSLVRYGDGREKIEGRTKEKFTLKRFVLNCLDNLSHVGLYLLIGILLGSLITIYLPMKNQIYNMLSKNSITVILFAALIGIPLYACGGGAIPLVHSLMARGMTKGAALAFFIVGPATRPSPIMAMAVMLRPLYILFYCVFLIVCSVLMGLIYV